jgi:hypothetical protein
MSLQTWKAEFYPIDAIDCPEDQAISHSLQKWLGLLPENLAKHEVQNCKGKVIEAQNVTSDAPGVWINADSCALCRHHHADDPEEDEFGDEQYCNECPLAITRGGACDHRLMDDDQNEYLEAESPWHEFNHNRDPQPMIYWLQQTQQEAK